MSDSPYGPPANNNDGNEPGSARNDGGFGQGGYPQHGQQGEQFGGQQGYPSSTQPGYPGHQPSAPHGYQSGQQGYPSGQQGGYSASTPGPRKRGKLFDDGGAPNQLGLYAFFAGAAAVVVEFVLRLVQAGFIGTGAYAMLSVIALASTVLSVILGLLAVILGVTALTRAGASKTFAAIGLGIGATVLIGAISGILYSLLASAASNL
jgi:hypothetical protein